MNRHHRSFDVYFQGSPIAEEDIQKHAAVFTSRQYYTVCFVLTVSTLTFYLYMTDMRHAVCLKQKPEDELRKRSREGADMPNSFQRDILPAEISVADAAKYLGVGKKVIYHLLEYGELRAVRVRGKILIDPNSLREFRASGKQP